MLGKEKNCIAITIAEDYFKIVSLKGQPGSLRVMDVVRRDTRGGAEADVPAAIRSAVDGMGLKSPKALCVIPSDVVTTKNIEIPSLDPEEINSIIDLQAGRHTPFSREEILVGYIIIGVFQRNYTKVLLIIVNRDVIKRQLRILDDAGVKVDRVLFAPEAAAKFYARTFQSRPEDLPVGIIDLSQHSTDFNIEGNNTVITCRNIPIGLSHLIKEGAAAQERLIGEVVNSLEAYYNEDISQPPEVFILTSDDAKVKELQPLLQEKLKAKVKVDPYLDHIQAGQPVMLKLVSEFNDDSFLNLVSIGMEADHLQVDLTPAEIRDQRALEEKGRQAIIAGVMGIVLLFLFCGVFISRLYFRSLLLEKLEKVYTKVNRSAAALEGVSRHTRIIKNYVRDRMIMLDVINELYNLVPDEMYLDNVSISEDGNIDISGISASMSRVFNFVGSLQESGMFKDVKTKSTTAKKDRGKDVAAFEIGFKLMNAPDTSVDSETDKSSAKAQTTGNQQSQ